MSNMKVFYVRNDYKKRDITIVSDLQDLDGRKVIKFAWAFRSNHDTFIKKEGKALARIRLEQADVNYSSSFEVESPKFRVICANILKTILSSQSTPRKYFDDIEFDIEYFENDAYWRSSIQ